MRSVFHICEIVHAHVRLVANSFTTYVFFIITYKYFNYTFFIIKNVILRNMRLRLQVLLTANSGNIEENKKLNP